ncbi:MAG: hypothetical protein R2877_03275 [Bdellovibrionota bacterium]
MTKTVYGPNTTSMMSPMLEGFQKNPKLVQKFYNQRRKELKSRTQCRTSGFGQT